MKPATNPSIGVEGARRSSIEQCVAQWPTRWYHIVGTVQTSTRREGERQGWLSVYCCVSAFFFRFVWDEVLCTEHPPFVVGRQIDPFGARIFAVAKFSRVRRLRYFQASTNSVGAQQYEQEDHAAPIPFIYHDTFALLALSFGRQFRQQLWLVPQSIVIFRRRFFLLKSRRE